MTIKFAFTIVFTRVLYWIQVGLVACALVRPFLTYSIKAVYYDFNKIICVCYIIIVAVASY